MVALLIDAPRWPAHGRLWAHLVSDRSLVELHGFAARADLPRRSFDGDHYDVPAERHANLVRAGARQVTGRELVTALQGSGLRLPKRRGERVLASWADPHWPPGLAGHRVDCLASPLPPPTPALHHWLLSLDDAGRLAVEGDRLPDADVLDPRCGYLRIRPAPPAPWRYVALHRGRVVGAGRSVPVQLVRGVQAQDYWWPLLLHLLAPTS